MVYECVVCLWIIVSIKIIVDYRRGGYSDYVYWIFKKIMLIESIILIGLYFVINNMLPILFMKKNIGSFILLFLVWAGGGMECYKIKVIKDVGEKYKKNGNFDDMPSEEKKLYRRVERRIIIGYIWILCVMICLLCLLELGYVFWTGDYGGVMTF